MIKAAVVAVLVFVSAAARAEPVERFAAPSPSLLEQLQSQYRPHDWLRVTMGSTPLDLRARQIDEEGLSGLRARGSGRRRLEAYVSGPSSRGHIAWSSISRIDKLSESRTGRIAGIVVGGIAGAAIVPQPYLGAMFGTFAGGWVGGRIADRFVRARPWYVARPLPAASDTAVAIVEAKTLAPDTTAATPPISTQQTETPSTGKPSRVVLRACHSLKPENLLRLEADFGRFQGYASEVGPQGLAGLRVDLVEGSSPPPPGLVTWDRIDRLEKRGGSAGRGAFGGALVVGTVSAALGVMVVLFATALGGEVDAGSAIAVVGGAGLAGGALGAGIGGLVGAPIPGWHLVYERPGTHKHTSPR